MALTPDISTTTIVQDRNNLTNRPRTANSLRTLDQMIKVVETTITSKPKNIRMTRMTSSNFQRATTSTCFTKIDRVISSQNQQA